MATNEPTLSDLFPESSRLLLTGGGKEFIERLGVEAVRQVILGIMRGENVRTQTEPLSRRRLAQMSGAMVAMFANGWLDIDHFTDKLSQMAVEQIIHARRSDKMAMWPAQWALGLTDKSVQNVLRNNRADFQAYILDFEAAINDAAEKCQAALGDLHISLGYVEDGQGRRVDLDWRDVARLTTAIGSQTLTIRGSDKSMYGKLFERLVLGSFLTVLGFERVERNRNQKSAGVFWLSDSSDERESDATLLVSPGKAARFDIGFIGAGNPEISKDKLSRYAREIELADGISNYVTFIIVDTLPKKGTTEAAAKKIGAEIIQMSMQYWPQQLARSLGRRLNVEHVLQTMPEAEMSSYLAAKLANIRVQDLLIGVALEAVETEVAEAEPSIDPFDDDEA